MKERKRRKGEEDEEGEDEGEERKEGRRRGEAVAPGLFLFDFIEGGPERHRYGDAALKSMSL
jgi:hypothetical protein